MGNIFDHSSCDILHQISIFLTLPGNGNFLLYGCIQSRCCGLGLQSGFRAALWSQWSLFPIHLFFLTLPFTCITHFCPPFWTDAAPDRCMSWNVWEEPLWQLYFFTGQGIHKIFPFRKVFKELHTFCGGSLALWVQFGTVLQIPLSELLWISFLLEGNSAVPREDKSPHHRQAGGQCKRRYSLKFSHAPCPWPFFCLKNERCQAFWEHGYWWSDQGILHLFLQ